MVKIGTANANELTNSDAVTTSRYIGINGAKIALIQDFFWSSAMVPVSGPELDARFYKFNQKSQSLIRCLADITIKERQG